MEISTSRARCCRTRARFSPVRRSRSGYERSTRKRSAGLSPDAVYVRCTRENTRRRRKNMKYLLQNYPGSSVESFEQLSADEQQAIVDEYLALRQFPGILAGEQLQPVETATTVRVQNGETLLTDGPFVDAKEHVGGFIVVDVDDLDAALELAARVPAARMGGAVEVRPLVER